MREIIFRGKVTVADEWIFGSLIEENGKYLIRAKYDDIGYRQYEIQPETIGQYTGLYDLEGNKIFEGDIVEVNKRSYDFKDRELYNCVIQWDSLFVGFSENKEANVDSIRIFWEIEHIKVFYDIFDTRIKVIGNIHDNPELIT